MYVLKDTMMGTMQMPDKMNESLAIRKILDRAIRQNRDLTVYEKEVISRIRMTVRPGTFSNFISNTKMNKHLH